MTKQSSRKSNKNNQGSLEAGPGGKEVLIHSIMDVKNNPNK